MSLNDEIMGKLSKAMGEVDKVLGPIEPSLSVRPFVPAVLEEEPVAQEPERPRMFPANPDLAPGSIVEWMKLLHSQHDHMAAKMDLVEARVTSERESLLTQVTEQNSAILKRLDEIAKFLGL